MNAVHHAGRQLFQGDGELGNRDQYGLFFDIIGCGRHFVGRLGDDSRKPVRVRGDFHLHAQAQLLIIRAVIPHDQIRGVGNGHERLVRTHGIAGLYSGVHEDHDTIFLRVQRGGGQTLLQVLQLQICQIKVVLQHLPLVGGSALLSSLFQLQFLFGYHDLLTFNL